MNFLKYAIGIDMGMEKLDACISLMTVQQQVIVKAQCNFNNDYKGFVLFHAWVIKNIKMDLPIIFLMEATGVYYEQLAWFLYDKGCTVSVVLPNKAKKYKDALGLNMRCSETSLLKKCTSNNWPYYKKTKKICRNE